MGIIFDLIIIAIILLSIFLGYKKGFVKVAVKLFALLIAVVVTLVLYKPISNLVINNTEIDEKIEQVIIENGTKEIEESNDEEESGFLNYIEQYAENTIAETQNDMVRSAAKVLSEKIINIGVIIGLFIITRVLLILLTLISDVITSLPIIKQFNKAGGTIYGILRGLLLVYAILAVLFFIVSMSANNDIVNIINNSIITKFMYSNNLLLKIIF